MTLAYVETLRAAVALADGEHDEARASLERSADVIQGSREPQFLGWFGSLRGELERRCGDLAAARAAIDDGLDAIEFCSEDLPRLALLSETGAAIEGDAAQRARDLGDETAEREAISRAELFEMRAEACADEVRPVEVARLETVRAHLARARGKPDPELDAAAADAWRAVARPYPMAIAQLHRAETLVERGERDDAAAQLADVLTTAEELGAPLPLPTGEEAPAPEPAGEDPFGLTPRELQVLKLLAGGATNREIGAQLFMAEKTASVHVSRILAKLDVRSRTEAAAVAHRFGVVG
jgi:DNA-binding CsgD family transcriptional regulator